MYVHPLSRHATLPILLLNVQLHCCPCTSTTWAADSGANCGGIRNGFKLAHAAPTANTIRNQNQPRRIRQDRVCIRATSSAVLRSEEHTSELQSLMSNSYAVFCFTKKPPKYHSN